MLGGFSILSGDVVIRELAGKPLSTCKQLQYLIAHRYKAVPQDEFVQLFLPGSGEDYASAMREILYGIRSAMKEGGILNADEIILCSGSGYGWNNDMLCRVDAEEFEKLCHKAEAAADEEERLDALLEAIWLYTGDYLPDSGNELWAVHLSRYYRSMYIKCVYETLGLLLTADPPRASEAEEISIKALGIDPFDETVHEFKLRSLIALGKYVEALSEYKDAEKLLYDEMGISLSDSLRDVYAELQRIDVNQRKPLESMINDWIKDADSPGAYYCDYGVFKTVYQIEARSIMRSGKSVFIIRFDIDCGDDEKMCREVMKKLGKLIPKSLRKGDIYTRPGANQYILMLHSLTYENCLMLQEKVLRTLNIQNPYKYITVTTKQITPIT